jgi:hypothetical protein
VERVRRFGDVDVALALWKRLRLDEFFSGVMEAGREQVPWPLMAAIHGVAWLCEPSSDLAIAESFFGRTALDDLLGIDQALVNDDRLYRALDVLVVHREALFGHLRWAYGELFGCEFDVLLFDATSTFFEGQMPASALGRRGYSRDSRPNCLQVLIGLVVTPQGLPLAYEVFEGNRHDSSTVWRMMELMEERYGRARRTLCSTVAWSATRTLPSCAAGKQTTSWAPHARLCANSSGRCWRRTGRRSSPALN